MKSPPAALGSGQWWLRNIFRVWRERTHTEVVETPYALCHYEAELEDKRQELYLLGVLGL
jgi:hypothetical protein